MALKCVIAGVVVVAVTVQPTPTSEIAETSPAQLAKRTNEQHLFEICFESPGRCARAFFPIAGINEAIAPVSRHRLPLFFHAIPGISTPSNRHFRGEKRSFSGTENPGVVGGAVGQSGLVSRGSESFESSQPQTRLRTLSGLGAGPPVQE